MDYDFNIGDRVQIVHDRIEQDLPLLGTVTSKMKDTYYNCYTVAGDDGETYHDYGSHHFYIHFYPFETYEKILEKMIEEHQNDIEAIQQEANERIEEHNKKIAILQEELNKKKPQTLKEIVW